MEAARLWARGEFNQAEDHAKQAEHLDEQFAFFGLVPDQPTLDPVKVFHLWPENESMWRLWLACRTQWRHGSNGPTGLDYAGVEVVMRRRGVAGTEAGRCFDLLQAMELGALAGWGELRAEAEPDRKR